MKLRGVHLLAAALCLAQPCGHAVPLPELIDSVLSTHPSLRAQRALGASANAAVEGARWQFYPTPSIGFEQVGSDLPDPSYPSSGDKSVTTVRLQQPLWTGGRLTAGLDKAQAAVLANQAALEGARQDLALRVVQVYADWYGALLKRQAHEDSQRAHQRLQEQIQRRIANGVSPQSDLTLLLGRQLQTDADLAATMAQEQSALQRLGQLLGQPAPRTQTLMDTMGAPLALAGSAEDLLQQAQARNPGMVKMRALARVAEAEIAERRAELLPEAYIRAEQQYGSYTLASGQPISRLFIGFSSHLGAGLSSLSQVSGALARYDAALADIDSARVSLGEQIQADYAQAEAGKARLSALLAALESADAIAQAWSRQFVAGRKSWLDVMNAVRELTQLETQIADARAAQLLLTWRLSILGHGLELALGLADFQALRAHATAEEPGSTHALDAIRLPEQTAEDYRPLHEDALALRMAHRIDPIALGAATRAEPAQHPRNNEGLW